MSRRMKGEGSIMYLDKVKAHVRVNVLRDSIRKPLSHTVPISEAVSTLKALQKQVANKDYMVDKGVTVNMMIPEWLQYVRQSK